MGRSKGKDVRSSATFWIVASRNIPQISSLCVIIATLLIAGSENRLSRIHELFRLKLFVSLQAMSTLLYMASAIVFALTMASILSRWRWSHHDRRLNISPLVWRQERGRRGQKDQLKGRGSGNQPGSGRSDHGPAQSESLISIFVANLQSVWDILWDTGQKKSKTAKRVKFSMLQGDKYYVPKLTASTTTHGEMKKRELRNRKKTDGMSSFSSRELSSSDVCYTPSDVNRIMRKSPHMSTTPTSPQLSSSYMSQSFNSSPSLSFSGISGLSPSITGSSQPSLVNIKSPMKYSSSDKELIAGRSSRTRSSKTTNLGITVDELFLFTARLRKWITQEIVEMLHDALLEIADISERRGFPPLEAVLRNEAQYPQNRGRTTTSMFGAPPTVDRELEYVYEKAIWISSYLRFPEFSKFCVEHVVERLHVFANGAALEAFLHAGPKSGDSRVAYPYDSQIIIRWFSQFMNEHLALSDVGKDRRGFIGTYFVVKSSRKENIIPKHDIAIVEDTTEDPPYYYVQLRSGNSYKPLGMNNRSCVFHAIIYFILHVMKESGGVLGNLYIDSKYLRNLVRVVSKKGRW